MSAEAPGVGVALREMRKSRASLSSMGVAAQAEESLGFSVAKWKCGSLTSLIKHGADVMAENKAVSIPFTPGITSDDTRTLNASLLIIGKKLL